MRQSCPTRGEVVGASIYLLPSVPAWGLLPNAGEVISVHPRQALWWHEKVSGKILQALAVGNQTGKWVSVEQHNGVQHSMLHVKKLRQRDVKTHDQANIAYQQQSWDFQPSSPASALTLNHHTLLPFSRGAGPSHLSTAEMWQPGSHNSTLLTLCTSYS